MDTSKLNSLSTEIKIIEELKYKQFKAVDVLLCKYIDKTLTVDETHKLIELLQKEYNETVNIGSKLAISLFIERLKLL